MVSLCLCGLLANEDHHSFPSVWAELTLSLGCVPRLTVCSLMLCDVSASVTEKKSAMNETTCFCYCHISSTGI